MKKFLLCLIAFFFLGTPKNFGQSGKKSDDLLFLMNHNSLYYGFSFAPINTTSISGNSGLHVNPIPIQEIGYVKTINYNNYFGLNLGLGFALHHNKGFVDGFGLPVHLHLQKSFFSPQIHFQHGLVLRYPINKTNWLNVQINHFRHLAFQSNIKTEQYNNGDDMVYIQSTSLIGIPRSFSFQLGITKPTKNNNLITYQGFYNFHLGKPLSGSYGFTTNNRDFSFGSFTRSKNQIGFKVNYSFTMQEKAIAYQQKIKEAGFESKSEMKKDLRMEERKYKRPEGTYLNFMVGFGNFRANASGSEIIKGHASSDFNMEALLEKHKNHYFIELGLGVQKYHGFISINQPSNKEYYSMGESTNAFVTGGVGKKMLVGNNFHLFNLHTGFKIGYMYVNQSLNGQLHQNLMEDKSDYSLDYKVSVNKKPIPMLYAGISKDFLLSNKTYLNFRYQYNATFSESMKNEVEYIRNNHPTTFTSKITTNAANHSFKIGIKYLLKP